MMQFDKDNMVMKLEGATHDIAKVVMVKNDKGDLIPWFQAKPIVVYIGYQPTNVSKTLNKISEKYKKPLKELLGDSAEESPLEHNDSIALYISEFGLYELLCKSELASARPFQDWVYEEVLPQIRKTGQFIPKRRSVPIFIGAALKKMRITTMNVEENQLALATKFEESQMALATKFEESQMALATKLAETQLALLKLQTDNHLTLSVKLDENQSFLMTKIGNLPLQLAGTINGTLNGFFSTGNKFFQYLGDFIQGKKQRKKASHNARMFPHDQRATDRDMVFQLTLLKVALELSPDLTPRVYDFVKNAYGKRAKCLRTFLHAQGSRPMTEKPLMWTNIPNGGQQYVYLESEKDILTRAWTDVLFGATKRRAASCQDMAAAKLLALVADGLPLGEWTSDTCTLLLPDLSGRADE